MQELAIYAAIGGTGVTAERFREELQAVKPTDDLTVRINSPGGAVFDGLSIFQQLATRPGPTRVEIDGIAASIASVIALAGDSVGISASGEFMIHDPMGPSAIKFGRADELRKAASETNKTADLLDKVREKLVRIYDARSPAGEDAIRQWMSDETYFDATEAKAAGFVDRITSAGRIAACVKQRALSIEIPIDDLQACADLCDEIEPKPRAQASAEKLRLAQAKLRSLQ